MMHAVYSQISFDITKLEVSAGDTVVAKFEDFLSAAQVKALREGLERSLPEGVKIIMIARPVKSLEVKKRETSAA